MSFVSITLHRKDEGRIKNERVCTVCGQKVAWKDIVRGYEYAKDAYVALTDEDFEKASPEASHSVDIAEFVDLRGIDPTLFDVPYYLEPERRGAHAYVLLREALRKSGKVGIARVVIRTRERLAALKPNGNCSRPRADALGGRGRCADEPESSEGGGEAPTQGDDDGDRTHRFDERGVQPP